MRILSLTAVICLSVIPFSPKSIWAQNSSVGTPASSFSVSPMGGATLSIPIEMPQGLPGAQPQLALVYNSQSGNGIAGYGCSISGISAITRGTRDIFHDSQASGTTGNDDDAFYLDGQRLIRMPNTQQGDSVEFRLEKDPFTCVMLHGISNTSGYSRYFKVHCPDGMSYDYGEYASSQLRMNTPLGNAYVQEWYLNRATAPTGNTITYTYQEHLNQKYLTSVHYGDNYVRFNYEARTDTVRRPIFHGSVKMAKRLCNIVTTTLTGGIEKTFRQYMLTYDTIPDATTTGCSRLSAISMSNGADESMNPIDLTWHSLPCFNCVSNSPLFSPSIYSYGAREDDMSFFAADMNGDGRSDIIQMAREYVAGVAGSNYLNIYHAQPSNNGGTNFQRAYRIQLPSTLSISEEWNNRYSAPTAMDIEGDGYNELLLPVYVHTPDAHYFGLQVYKDGNDIGGVIYDSLHVDNMDDVLWAAADFNRDGKGEAVIIEKATDNSGAYYGAFIGGHTIQTAFCKRFRLPLPDVPRHVLAMDMDNNGMTDVVVFHDDGYRIFWNDSNWLSNQGTISQLTYSAYSLSHQPVNVWPGDFNGDGTCDFLLLPEDDNHLYFEMGTGNGTLAEKVAYATDITDKWDTDRDDHITCFVADLDGDGKTDVFFNKGEYEDASHWYESTYYEFDKNHSYWFFSDGQELQQKKHAISNRKHDQESRFYISGDFNGDGLTEIASLSYDCYNGWYANESPIFRIYGNGNYSTSSGKLNIVRDGFGKSTQVEYKPLTDSSVYTRHTDATFPVIDVQAPLPAVASITQSNGTASNIVTNYRYGGLKAHAQGRGIMGMAMTAAENQTTGLSVENRVLAWSTNSYRPLHTRETQSLGESTATKETTLVENFYRNTLACYVHPQQVVSRDFDNCITWDTYSYAGTAFDGALMAHERYYDDNNAEKEYYTYTYAGGRYQPDTIETVRGHGDHSAYHITKTSHTYNGRGLMTQKKVGLGTPLALTTTYGYDNYGNLISSKTTGSGATTPTSYYTYDSSHRFVTKIQELGYKERRYSYDIWGNVLTETDYTQPAHPKTTAYTYDGWGNRVTTTLPTGDSISHATGWGTTASKRYYSYESGTKRPWKRTWYDETGREVLSESIGPKGISLTDSTSYNSKGEVEGKRTTRGNLITTENFTYDPRGRVLTCTSSTGKSVFYSYGKRSMTSIWNNRTYTEVYDSWGNVKKATDPQDSVLYEYHSCGNPKKVISSGAEVCMGYDNTGNQILLTDPDAGTLTYSYDALGRIVTQHDGRGIVTHNTRNGLSQLTQTQTGDITTAYTYGLTNDNRGLLMSESREGNSISYAYDEYGRITTETRSVAGLGDRIFCYTYDNGLLASKTFPDNLTVTYEYDAYGNKLRTTINGNTVWEQTSYTGGYSVESLGNSFALEKGLDAKGYPQVSVMRQGGQMKYYMQYSFDGPTGNLKSRGGTVAAAESFVYDNADRLTGVSGPIPLSINYSSNGNITYQTGIGHYHYESEKPHAVTGVENTDNSIPHSQLETEFNSHGKISRISNVGNGYSMDFSYGPDNERWRTRLYKNNSLLRTIYYMGDYEEIVQGTTTRKFFYLDDNVLLVREAGLADSTYYLFRDHLGSVMAIVNETGQEVFRATYDAWGRQSVTRNDIGYFRGYTGHEMLPEFGLINMNGRLYDPLLGRFLSCDNFVQEPYNSQNFNRYSYCLNNPLKYVDPDGEMAWFIPVIAGAVIGAYAGASIQSRTIAFWNWNPDAWKGAIVGGIVGGAIGFQYATAMHASGMSVSGLMNTITNVETATNTFRNVEIFTKAAGITNSILQSGVVNIGANTIFGRGWDGVWKAGIAGLATGAWSVTGGFGMSKGFGATTKLGKLSWKLGYQMIGTSSISIGNNWSNNKNLFSNLTLGIGPVNLTIGGKDILRWQNNIGNILVNVAGASNMIFGGKAKIDSDNLSFVYTGGLRDKYFDSDSGFGSYAIFGGVEMSNDTFTHELHHLWQSRAMNNLFWPNYFAHSISSILLGEKFYDAPNYYEQIGYFHYWY